MVRHPAFAGSFYPAEEATLRAAVTGYLERARVPVPGDRLRLRALVVPHAGYSYSGAVAGSAYAVARRHQASFRNVLLLGPSHRVAFDGWAVGDANSLETPLGRLGLAQELRSAAEVVPGGSQREEALAREHSLEVQLPFLQVALPHCPVLPVLVGRAPSSQLARLAAHVADESTLIVVSTDLSHYESDEVARELDEETAQQIEQLAPPIATDRACGAYPLNGFLEFACGRGWHGQRLDLRNSGDTAGDRSRVVGYGAFAFWEDQ